MPGITGGYTALLCAATSLDELIFDESNEDHDNRNYWVRSRITRGEELMHLLLDRGASARDTIKRAKTNADGGQPPQQPLDTVLGLAISWASYELVTRLIAEGAEVHAQQEYCVYGNGGGGFGDWDVARDVTALHLGSLSWSVEGIQALLDHRDSDIDISDMVSMRDSAGRVPLHWAAAGGDGHSERLLFSEDNISSRIVDTFKLLVAGNPSTINIQDKRGATALHYAVGNHAGCGNRHSELAIRFLCENGADPGLQDSNGKTVLHMLAFYSIDGEPINPAVLDLLVAHGANVGQTDMDGNTALHIMVRNLRQVKAAHFLISRGVDISARNAKANTLIHEAMRGVLRPWGIGEEIGDVTLIHRIRAQNEVISVLEEAEGYNRSLMDLENAEGKTPRQLLWETRSNWCRVEDRERGPPGRGRGRPLSRGSQNISVLYKSSSDPTLSRGFSQEESSHKIRSRSCSL